MDVPSMSAEESDLKLNHTVFFSPFLQIQILSPLDILFRRKASRGPPTPQPPKAFCEKHKLIFCRAFLSNSGSCLSVGKFCWVASLVP